jgi:hypothetical protein
MEINASAPVIASGSIEIAARPEVVWDLLADIMRWPEWNADVKSTSMAGAVESGEVFRWKAGPARLVSTLQTVERPTELSWTGQTMGMSAVHVWRLESDGDTTTAHTEESWEGAPAKLLPRMMHRSLQKSLDAWLGELKAAAEAKAG